MNHTFNENTFGQSDEALLPWVAATLEMVVAEVGASGTRQRRNQGFSTLNKTVTAKPLLKTH